MTLAAGMVVNMTIFFMRMATPFTYISSTELNEGWQKDWLQNQLPVPSKTLRLTVAIKMNGKKMYMCIVAVRLNWAYGYKNSKGIVCALIHIQCIYSVSGVAITLVHISIAILVSTLITSVLSI